ncbi:WXG100 family type VII secretion target [Saccharopolyspora sp. NFXS83]|uniref:WXG100 family type VII secretion target n=1 Tax=Saccharopolyspora sp. NFXS83 TaxID=2993560 RepID=UPI00224AA186|nr:WXG100 family type VII secretion target [Saccharopolyspora sp. NFXS83]MCX2731716.1 WXG100 family type VII secretion target [Saccharopolyspora sp. NFXS83]
MSGQMEMRPEEIRAGGKRIGDAGSQLSTVLQQLKSGLDAEGECWGGDEAGQKFAESYVKNSTDVSDGMKKLAEALGNIRDNLTATADDTEGRDEQAASDIGNVPQS